MKHICPVCNKTNKGEQLTKEESASRHFKFLKRPCKTCRAVMKESVTLTCLCCDSITMVNSEVFTKRGIDVKVGEVADVQFCPGCPPEKNPSKSFKF